MKKLISLMLCMLIVLSGCTAAQGIAEDSTEDNTNEASILEANESTSSGKPALEMLDGEDEDLDRAVQNRTNRIERANAYYLISNNELTKQITKDYTVMIYVVGSNLESRYGAATSDIAEMEEAGLDYDKVNLLLYTGGSRRWVSDIPNSTNSILDLSRADDSRIVAQTAESADMGAPETLTEFVNFCTRNYPAEHYALILWNHGGGPLWGYGSDELFNNDSLILEEMRETMSSTEFGPDHKLDWVGFDACLMGSLENAVLWKDYARYLVSSEEVEPGKGWDYHFLSGLNESQDTEQIVKSIVDAYAEFYDESRSELFDPNTTLSVMDLSKTDEVTESIGLLLDAMSGGIGEGKYARINKARSKVTAFGLDAVDSLDAAYDLLDVQDFANRMKEMYPEESERAADAVSQMVLYSKSNVEGAQGVSFYLPGNNKSLFRVSEDLYAEGTPLPKQYSSFVDTYTDEWFSETEINWDLGEIEEGDGELTLQLTKEQEDNTSQAFYSVFWKMDSNMYARAMLDIPVEVDENGVLHIPADPMLVTVSSDIYESSTPWTCRQIGQKGGTNTYETLKTIICTAYEVMLTGFSPEYDDPVGIVFSNKQGESETKLKDIVAQSEGSWSSGKESVDVTNYTTVMDLGTFGKVPVHDENGQLKPYEEWESGGTYTGEPVAVDNSFHFIMKKASEFPLEFTCQVTIRDIHDGIHASELKELPVEHEQEIVDVETEKGVLRYEIFDDHAEVYEYEGSDNVVEVADSVEGKPVTIVSFNAFGNQETVDTVYLPDTIEEIMDEAMPYMKQVRLPIGLKRIGIRALSGYQSTEIEIPDSVEVIGSTAFSHSNLKSVTLPASLKKIEPMAFCGCDELKEIQIDGSNPNYKSVDGVLYSADGKTLLEYPRGKGDNYTIEQGTETIGYGAFASSVFYMYDEDSVALSGILFPDTLKKIENAAFFGCNRLDLSSLPDSLEEIGSLAFGEELAESGDAVETVIDQVHIGPNVSRIGKKAFSALNIKEFDVDSGNLAYASAGGFLTNKACDTILEAPEGVGEKVVIPEGITTLPNLVFAGLQNSSDYYIPDTVFRFASDVFGDPEAIDLSGITIVCSKGSAAEQYAKKCGIACDTED